MTYNKLDIRNIVFRYLTELNCRDCAIEVVESGGCLCLNRENQCDVNKLIPPGCHHCEDDTYAISQCDESVGKMTREHCPS